MTGLIAGAQVSAYLKVPTSEAILLWWLPGWCHGALVLVTTDRGHGGGRNGVESKHDGAHLSEPRAACGSALGTALRPRCPHAGVPPSAHHCLTIGQRQVERRCDGEGLDGRPYATTHAPTSGPPTKSS